MLVEMFALSPEDSNSYFQRHGAKLMDSVQRALLGCLLGSMPCTQMSGLGEADRRESGWRRGADGDEKASPPRDLSV